MTMAAAFIEEDLVVCRICLEQYNDPRILPSCDHSFCARCILDYFQGQHGTADQDRNNKFECPLCRTVTVIPSEEFNEWVETLPKDTEILSQNKRAKVTHDTMINRDTEEVFCCICNELGKKVSAASFCVECQEHFCKTCSDIHKVSKLSKTHTVVDAKNVFHDNEDVNAFFYSLSKYTHCLEHDGKPLEFFCNSDKTLLCLTCYFMHHKNCSDVSEICKNLVRESIKRKLKNLKGEHLKLSKFAQEAIDKLGTVRHMEQNERAKLNTRLHDIRVTVVKLLDSLEENVQLKHRTVHKQNHIRSSELTDKLHSSIGRLEIKIGLIEQLLSIGTNSQLFVALQKIQDEFQELEMEISEYCNSFKISVCNLIENGILREILEVSINETERLARIESGEQSLDLPLYSTSRNFTTEKIQKVVIREDQFVHYGPLFTCLLYVANKTLLLVDNRFGHCFLINERGDVKASCTFMPNRDTDVDFKHTPSSATALQDDVIAVSVSEERKIYIVDNENLARLAHVNTKYKAQHIQGLSNGDIAVAWEDPVAFGIISSVTNRPQWVLLDRIKVIEKVYFTKDKNGRALNAFDGMAVDDQRLRVMQACKAESAVYCLDFKGNTKFCYRNPELIEPTGLAVDKLGNTFVCEERNSGIHILSISGTLLRIVKDGSPLKPLAIGFDKNKQHFAVTNSGLGFAGCEITFFRIVKMRKS